ncbi:MAG: selenocysteine-specific translation elongation factor [Candidatus Thorarchaeota archaeon]|jgi:selenocysteine-specific elongation factor
MEDLTPVHIGLMGHIDHGKTELARALSERVSTAGLDKHPQSKERGITIDLGFTMFVLGDYLATLVDAPGHADLIRSVVASAGIIDTAILVVAVDEGPQVQTGEHIVVLRAMGIDTVVVVLSKSDLVDNARLEAVESSMRSIIEGVGFETVRYTRTSALNSEGIDSLRTTLLEVIKPVERDIEGSFLMPIDHSFTVRGHGTVLTGTVLRGTIEVGDTAEIRPQGMIARLRTIQTYGANRQRAEAGDRIGINVPEIDSKMVSRGDYVCVNSSLQNASGIITDLTLNPLYRGRVTNGMNVSATIGMPSVTAEVFPFSVEDKKRVMLEQTSEKRISAALLLQRKVAVESGMNVLLIRTDLPPTSMRIVASGHVVELPESVRLHRRRERRGQVSRIREDDVLIEGLAHSNQSAALLIGTEVQSLSGHRGVLLKPFGTRGVLAASFDDVIEKGDVVVFTTLKEVELGFGR